MIQTTKPEINTIHCNIITLCGPKPAYICLIYLIPLHLEYRAVMDLNRTLCPAREMCLNLPPSELWIGLASEFH